MEQIDTQQVDRLNARLDTEERAPAARGVTRASSEGAPSPAARTVPIAVTEVLRPTLARSRMPSRRTLLKGAGALVFTTALLATGEVVPVAPLHIAAADPITPPAPPSGTGATVEPVAPPTRQSGSGASLIFTADTVYRTFVGSDFLADDIAKGRFGVNSGTNYPSGPMYQSTGVAGASFIARVELPQGATITELVFWVIHNDANSQVMTLGRFAPYINGQDAIAGLQITSVSASVQTVTFTTFSNVTVDNTYLSYVLGWNPGTVGAAHQLYGARLGFKLPNNAQLYGRAQSGAGVYGVSGSGTGVEGDADNIGVLGFVNSSSTVINSAAVSGTNGSSVSGVLGVRGFADGATAIGVSGVSNSGIGVQGTSGSLVAVQGQADAAGATGVKGKSLNGFPIIGNVTGAGNTAAGVLGAGTAGPGVQGQSTGGHGLVGTTNDGNGHAGLIGNANTTGGIGLMGIAPNYGQPTVGHAGEFYGNVKIFGGTLLAPVMQAAVKHQGDGSYRALPGIVAPEGWIEDFGTGTLAADKAEITLDHDFAALIESGYHVFLTPEGPQHLHISQKSGSGFTVVATPLGSAGGPKPAVGGGTFSWRVVGKRKDMSGERLAKVATPAAPPRPSAFAIPESPDAKPPSAKP